MNTYKITSAKEYNSFIAHAAASDWCWASGTRAEQAGFGFDFDYQPILYLFVNRTTMTWSHTNDSGGTVTGWDGRRSKAKDMPDLWGDVGGDTSSAPNDTAKFYGYEVNQAPYPYTYDDLPPNLPATAHASVRLWGCNPETLASRMFVDVAV
jgi:hypothetical protein